MSSCGKRSLLRHATRLAAVVLAAALPQCDLNLQLPAGVTTAGLRLRVFVMQDYQDPATATVRWNGDLHASEPCTLPGGLSAAKSESQSIGPLPRTGRPQAITVPDSQPLCPGLWDIHIQLETTSSGLVEFTCPNVRIDDTVQGNHPPVELEWVEGSPECTSPANTALRARGEHDVGPVAIRIDPAPSTGAAATVRVDVRNAGRVEETNVVVNLSVQSPGGPRVPLPPVTITSLPAQGDPTAAPPVQWTPTAEGMHTLTADVTPVSG